MGELSDKVSPISPIRPLKVEAITRYGNTKQNTQNKKGKKRAASSPKKEQPDVITAEKIDCKA